MNIRKKILFKPSQLKSTKPDTSDTTTAHTKNSAILEQSKTFRFYNQKTISTRRQRNYLRTLSKDPKQSDLSYNHTASVKKRNIIIPSLSNVTNENFISIKKNLLGKKLLMEQDQLPPLFSLKRTDLMTSQQQRKLFNYPSSVHVNSIKEISMRDEIKKQSTQHEQQRPKHPKPQAQMMILGQNYEQIERRKQKLNSLNVASFYTTQRSIAFSKYSIKSRQNNFEGKGNSADRKEIESGEVVKDQMVSRFASGGEDGKMELDCVKKSPQKAQSQPEEQIDESIAEQIQKNQSKAKGKPTRNKIQQNSQNEWSQTLKSSYADSTNMNEQKPTNQGTQDKINNIKFNSESSLCESEMINWQQVQQKKNTHRNANKSIQAEQISKSKKKPVWQANQNQKHQGRQVDLEESSLCQSYRVETPQKRCQ